MREGLWLNSEGGDYSNRMEKERTERNGEMDLLPCNIGVGNPKEKQRLKRKPKGIWWGEALRYLKNSAVETLKQGKRRDYKGWKKT